MQLEMRLFPYIWRRARNPENCCENSLIVRCYHRNAAMHSSMAVLWVDQHGEKYNSDNRQKLRVSVR